MDASPRLAGAEPESPCCTDHRVHFRFSGSHRCGANAKRGTCGNKLSVREDVLRNAVLDELRRRLTTPDAVEYLKRRIEPELQSGSNASDDTRAWRRTNHAGASPDFRQTPGLCNGPGMATPNSPESVPVSQDVDAHAPRMSPTFMRKS